MQIGRRFVVLVALSALVMVGSSCSVVQVQAWLAFHGAPGVSAEDARKIADAVNVNEPVGCDPNYGGGCVPTNATSVHCDDEPGAGPALVGWVTVRDWDHFGLDPDRNGVACEHRSPVGTFDAAYQKGFVLVVEGWTFDYDTSASTELHVYDNGVGHVVQAANDRPDLAQFGVGTRHGFRDYWEAAPGRHEVCAYAINVGTGDNTSLGCKYVDIMPVVITEHGTTATVALLERAEFVRSGDVGGYLRVTGFAYDALGRPMSPLAITPHRRIWHDPNAVGLPAPSVPRPDVRWFDQLAPDASGFDVTVPFPYAPTELCLAHYNGPGLPGALPAPELTTLSCRPVAVQG